MEGSKTSGTPTHLYSWETACVLSRSPCAAVCVVTCVPVHCWCDFIIKYYVNRRTQEVNVQNEDERSRELKSGALVGRKVTVKEAGAVLQDPDHLFGVLHRQF